MSRRPRLIGEGLLHHVYAWGNNRRPLFKEQSHYEKYLEYLERYSSQFNVDVATYALMQWHIHMSLFDRDGRLSDLMKRLHGDYARYFNWSTSQVGHVFGERFNNKIVQQDSHALWLSRYIHRQPVEAGLVKDPESYEWTSYRQYIGLAPRGFVKPDFVLQQFGGGEIGPHEYRKFVLGDEDGPTDWENALISVVGDEEFVRTTEALRQSGRSSSLACADPLSLVCCELGVEGTVLLRPRDKEERMLRREAFAVLVDKYGLSPARTARVFGVARSTVCRGLGTRTCAD